MIIGANKVAVDGSPEAMLARGGFTCDPRQVLRLHYGSSLYILQRLINGCRAKTMPRSITLRVYMFLCFRLGYAVGTAPVYQPLAEINWPL